MLFPNEKIVFKTNPHWLLIVFPSIGFVILWFLYLFLICPFLLVSVPGKACYILSRRYYKMVGEKGAYTRKKGLDRETNKALLLKHIQENRDSGSRLNELAQVLPALTMPQVQSLLRELKSKGQICNVGKTRAALWFPGSTTDSITSKKIVKRNTDAMQ